MGNTKKVTLRTITKKNDGCYQCERCGKKISSKTNKAKHQNTSRCNEIYEDNKQKELHDKIVKRCCCGNRKMNI